MARYLRSTLTVSLALYAIAVLTTMAGMEIFGWLSATLSLIGLIFFKDTYGLKQPVLELLDWIFFVLCAVIISSAIFKAPADADKLFIIGTSRFVLLFFLLRVGIEIVGPAKLKSLLPWLLVIVAVIGAYAVYQHYTGIDLIRGSRNPIPAELFAGKTTYRSRGMWDHPVRFGHSIALALCFPIAILLSHYRNPKWIVAGAALALTTGTAGLIFSMTRGAWIGLTAAVIVMSLYVGWRYTVAAGGLAAAAGGIAVAISPEVIQRFRSFLKPSEDYSSTARLDIWRANLEMFKDNPLLGVGYGQNEPLITEYYERLGITQQDGGHAHNNFIQFLSGTGLAGFLTYTAFSVLALALTHRVLREAKAKNDLWLTTLGLAAMGAQVVIHVGGLTEASFKSAQINHQYLLILALLVAVWRRSDVRASRAEVVS